MNTNKQELQYHHNITQRILAIQAGFQNKEDRRNALERVVCDHYEHLRSSSSASQEYIARSLNVLNDVLKYPKQIEQKLFTHYIAEILRFVGNVGLGFEFGEAFIDRIMVVYRQCGYSLIELYLAKAKFFPIDAHEHGVREKIFFDAKKYAEEVGDYDGLISILLALTDYYTATGQYKKSINTCKKCENIIKENSVLSGYQPFILASLGVTYFTMCDPMKARRYLLMAKEMAENANDDDVKAEKYSINSILEWILHYLGREAERSGDLYSAMVYYVKGHQYQQLVSEDPGGIAFYHLRVAEVLIAASRLDQAREHLQKSQEIIANIVIAGSAHEQVRATWAEFYDKAGEYEKARESIKGSIKEAERRNVLPIELLCLLKLLSLEIRYRRVRRSILAAVQFLKRWRGILKILRNIAFARLLFSKQLSHLFGKKISSQSSLDKCMCPMHLDRSSERR
jgi:tetratricopeptide (TPR) repeat protein